MGERILKPGIRTSEKTAANIRDGGWMAQVFYDWLITIVDDFGRYDARPSILRAEMFPLLLELVREADVSRCLKSCEAAGLVRLYSTGGKDFLEITQWKQRMRAATSKWPAPPGKCRDSVMTMPTDTETDTETDTGRVAMLPDPANKLAAALGIEGNIGQKQRGELQNLISVDGYEAAKKALQTAIAKGIGPPGCISYASKIVTGNKAKNDLNGHATAPARNRRHCT